MKRWRQSGAVITSDGRIKKRKRGYDAAKVAGMKKKADRAEKAWRAKSK